MSAVCDGALRCDQLTDIHKSATSSQNHVGNHKPMMEDVQSIQNTISEAEVAISVLTSRCEELERVCESGPIIRKEICGQIDQCMKMIRRSIMEREEFLINELDMALRTYNEISGRLYKEFESRLQRLSSHVDHLKRLSQSLPMESSNLENSIARPEETKRNIALQKHKQEVEKLLPLTIPLHPSEFDTTSFIPTELDQLLGMIKCVGTIVLTSIDAQHSRLADCTDTSTTAIRGCRVDQDVAVSILPKDSFGRLVTNANSKEFTASLNLRKTNCSEVMISDSNNTEKLTRSLSHHALRDLPTECETSLKLTYRISQPGAYDLNVKLYGEHILGSPYFVTARAAFTADTKLLLAELTKISRQTDRIRDVESSLRRCKSTPFFIKKVEPPTALADLNMIDRGDFLHTVGTKGRGLGEFANPSGICVARENRILVADSNNATVQVSDGFVCVCGCARLKEF